MIEKQHFFETKLIFNFGPLMLGRVSSRRQTELIVSHLGQKNDSISIANDRLHNHG